MTIHAPVPGGGDDTTTLQGLIDGATTGETLQFQSGSYRINSGVGLRLSKAVTLQMAPDTTLYVSDNTGIKARIIETIPGTAGVTIRGGRILGSLTPNGSSYSIGLRIDSASDVVVDGTVFENWITDGIYIGGNTPCQNVRLDRVRTVACIRSGIAIINADGVLIERSSFATSTGDPGSGVNVEPNVGDRVTDFSIYSSTFDNNRVGLNMVPGAGGLAGVKYRVIGCTFNGNTLYTMIANGMQDLVILDCSVPSGFRGVSLVNCSDVILAQSSFPKPRNIIAGGSVGVSNAVFFKNDMAGGRVETLEAGFTGTVLLA